MSSLHENKPLFCSLLGPLLVVVMLTFNIYPDFNRSLEIVEFSDEVCFAESTIECMKHLPHFPCCLVPKVNVCSHGDRFCFVFPV